jgi:hypothetical protein
MRSNYVRQEPNKAGSAKAKAERSQRFGAQMRGTGEAARQMPPLLRQKQKELEIMQNSNSRINVPEARNAMDQFKMQAASDLGVSGDY